MDEEELVDEQKFASHSTVTLTSVEKEQIKSVEKNILAGGIAGSLGKTVTAPLSRLTVLYQVSPLLQNKSSNIQLEDSLLKSFRNIVRKEGFLSLWKGNFTAVIHRFPFSALNFAVFEAVKSSYLSYRPQATDSPLLRMTCGAFAGAASCFICYPLDLVRIRLTVGWSTPSAVISNSLENQPLKKKRIKLGSKIFDTMARIIEKDGFLGLYHGLTASLLVAVPTYALSFSVYGQVKGYLLNQQRSPLFVNEKTGHLSAVGSLVSGSLSGVASAAFLFPLDVIRKRMQVVGITSAPSTTNQFIPTSTAISTSSINTTTTRTYAIGAKGLIGHARAIIAHDGIRGFYRGLLPEILKVCPMVAVTFCSYEMTKDTLDKYFP